MSLASTIQNSSQLTASSSDLQTVPLVQSGESISQTRRTCNNPHRHFGDTSIKREQSVINGNRRRTLKPTSRTSGGGSATDKGTEVSPIGRSIALHHDHDHADVKDSTKQAHVVSLFITPAIPPRLSTDAVFHRFGVSEAFLPPSHAGEDGKDVSTQNESPSVQSSPIGIYATQQPGMESSPTPRQRNMFSHASTSNFHGATSSRAPFAAISVTGHSIHSRDGRSSTEIANVIETEKIYRLHAGQQHDFHESLTLFLWDPVPVEVGAIGFLSQPAGQFVTLFNAMSPQKCDRIKIKNLSSLGQNGNVAIGFDKSDSRTLVHKAYDFVSGSRTLSKLLTTLSTRVGSKRHTLRLKAGKKTAYMHAEITEHHYFEDLQTSEKWFTDNIDHILSVYASHPEVKKETLMLVTGTIRTPNYGLFVSHNHPDGRAKFKVHPNSSHGQPWGVFTTAKGAGKCGPKYPDTAEDVPFDCQSKVSHIGDSWSTVLIARLQFGPGATEPTLH